MTLTGPSIDFVQQHRARPRTMTVKEMRLLNARAACMSVIVAPVKCLCVYVRAQRLSSGRLHRRRGGPQFGGQGGACLSGLRVVVVGSSNFELIPSI